MKNALRFFFLIASPLQLFSLESEELLAKKVYQHLLIHDERGAIAAVEEALLANPDSKILIEAKIKVYAKAGDEKEMFEAWQSYLLKFPEEQLNRDILETMASQVIAKGARSSSPVIRIFSLIASCLVNDKESVNIIFQGLNDRNSVVRNVAVEVASTMRDAKLADKIFFLLDQEKDWHVRLTAVEACGKMQLREAEEKILAITASPNSSAEERAAAVTALVNMLDHVERNELERFIYSDRAALRILGAKLIGHLLEVENLDLLITLLGDTQAEVRKSSLQAIGKLRPKDFNNQPITRYLEPHLKDKDPEVAILAAWLISINDSNRVEEVFKPWIEHEKPATKILASAALSATGKYGFPYILTAFEKAENQYVKMNLALSLISHRVSEERALKALHEGLSRLKERWMIKDYGAFEALAPSDVKHSDLIPNYPEAVNQMTRLQVINHLAIMRYPGTEQALKEFINERSWGITGLSSALLLTEGDEASIEIVRSLLKSSSSKVQVQAALVLALWGKDPEAISTLQNAYPSASRDVKEQILEGMGRIGDVKTIPFLTDKLQESFQSLRIIAASSILECLYH